MSTRLELLAMSAAAALLRGFDLQLFAGATFDINNPYGQMTRYLRRGKSGPTGMAIDTTVTPTFNALGAPTAPTFTPSTTGGVLAAGTTYNYRISAFNANGETLAGPEGTAATTTGATGSIAIAWSAVTGATGYNIYGRNTGTELLLATVGAVLTYTDTGAATPAGALPTVDTTGTIPGAIAGMINAGDMVYRTALGVASLNSPGTANANAASMVGVSEDTYPSVLGLGEGVTLGRPFNDATSIRVAIRQSGEFRFKTTPGDTYHPGDSVYVGLDAQTVQKTSSGTSIGKVCNDQNPVQGGDFSAVITGAVGQEVVIEIAPPAAV